MTDRLIDDDWLETCSPELKEVVKKYPNGTVFVLDDGNQVYLVGYSGTEGRDDICLLLTTINPWESQEQYDLAIKESFSVPMSKLESYNPRPLPIH